VRDKSMTQKTRVRNRCLTASMRRRLSRIHKLVELDSPLSHAPPGLVPEHTPGRRVRRLPRPFIRSKPVPGISEINPRVSQPSTCTTVSLEFFVHQNATISELFISTKERGPRYRQATAWTVTREIANSCSSRKVRIRFDA